MSKGGYVWIYFDFCWMVVNFWVEVGGGGSILASGGWCWVVS